MTSLKDSILLPDLFGRKESPLSIIGSAATDFAKTKLMKILYAETYRRYAKTAEKDVARLAKLLNEEDGLCLSAAKFASRVYGAPWYYWTPRGWKESKAFKKLQAKFDQRKVNGLVSCLYERTRGGRKEYVYATSGTDFNNPLDIINDVQQVFGLSKQYDEALAIASELSAEIKKTGDELIFCGHSLGGGEATLNALVTGRRAFVFNPAGLSLETLLKYGLDYPVPSANQLVKTIISSTDPLNIIQDDKNIPIEKLLPSMGDRYYVKVEGSDIVEGHSIDAIIKTLKGIIDA